MDLVEALVQTSFTGDVESLRVLLQQSAAAGVDLNFATEEGFTLLMHAINGASNPPQPGGQHLEVCQLLILSGVYIESVDATYGRTAAHWAACYNQADILSLLITAGCNMATPDLQGLTPFHLAVVSDALDGVEVVLQLVSAEILEFTSSEGLTPLMLAAHNGNAGVSKLLLKSGANPHSVEAIEQKTALHFAAQASNNVVVELLIKNGATLDLPDARGVTPLHIAASLNNTSVLNTICNIVGGAVLDIPDLTGLTPLMYACISGSEPCVKFILKKKAV